MKPTCSLCGGSTGVTGCGDGYVCEHCAENNRTGRDPSTRQAKMRQKALRGMAQQARFRAAGAAIPEELTYDVESALALSHYDPASRKPVVCGEALSPELIDTLAGGGTVAADASVERLELLSQLGVDAVALGLDASETIGAANSLEKALSHQLGAIHSLAMRYLHKSGVATNPDAAVKLANLSLRAMDCFQRGLVTVKKLRSTGQQQIRIEHVQVESGGQCAIVNGQSTPGAESRKRETT